MDHWQAYVDFFQDGIIGGTAGAVTVIVFIVGLCAFGLWKSRQLFKEI